MFKKLTYFQKKHTKRPSRKLPFKHGFATRKALIGCLKGHLGVGKSAFPTMSCSRKALPALRNRRNRRFFDCCFYPEKATFSCRKASVGLQRHCRWVAVRAPSQCDNGPVGRSRGPYGSLIRASRKKDGSESKHKQLKYRHIEKQRKYCRKIGTILKCSYFKNLRARAKNFRKSLVLRA